MASFPTGMPKPLPLPMLLGLDLDMGMELGEGKLLDLYLYLQPIPLYTLLGLLQALRLYGATEILEKATLPYSVVPPN